MFTVQGLELGVWDFVLEGVGCKALYRLSSRIFSERTLNEVLIWRTPRVQRRPVYVLLNPKHPPKSKLTGNAKCRFIFLCQPSYGCEGRRQYYCSWFLQYVLVHIQTLYCDSYSILLVRGFMLSCIIFLLYESEPPGFRPVQELRAAKGFKKS